MDTHWASPSFHGQRPALYEVPVQLPHFAEPVADVRPGRIDVPVSELGFCHLQGLADISRVAHLREEIRLPAGVRADPQFLAREKKETKMDLSVLSCCGGYSSGQFVSFQWTVD